MNQFLANKKEEKELFSPYQIFVSRLLEKICLTIIHWGTFLILFTPFIISGKFFFPFIAPKTLYFTGLVEIIFAAYLLLAICFPKYRPKSNIVLIFIVLFLFFSILAAVNGVCLSESFWSKYERMGGLLTWFHLLAFFLAISSVFTKKDWLRIFEISVMVAALISVLNILTVKNMGPLITKGFEARGGATLGNSSFLGSYLIFNVFLALYLFLNSKTKKETKIFFGAVFAFLAVALLISTARAAALSFIAGMVLLFLLKLIFLEKGKLRAAGISLLIISSIFLGIVMFYSLQHEDNLIRTTLEDEFHVGLSKDRLLVWNIGLKGWKEKPWLGWGPENFNIVFTRHFDSRIFVSEIYGNDIWYDRAHNIVVDNLVATGLLGSIAYFGILFSAFYVLFKKYSSQKIDFLIFGIFSVILIAYFFQNLTVFDMVSSYMMFFLILGFIASFSHWETLESSDRKEKNNFYLRLWAVPLALFVLVFSLFYFTIQPLRSNLYLIQAFKSSDFRGRMDLYKKCLAVSPLGKYQIKETITYRDSTKYSQEELFEKIPLEIQKEELEFMTQNLEDNVKESPLLFSSYLTLAKVYNLYAARIEPSKLEKAEQIGEKAIEVSPGNQQGYWVLSQTRLYQGRLEEAVALAEKAVDLEPRSKRSSLILIDIAAIARDLSGNDEILTKQINKVLEINPELAATIQMVLQQRYGTPSQP